MGGEGKGGHARAAGSNPGPDRIKNGWFQLYFFDILLWCWNQDQLGSNICKHNVRWQHQPEIIDKTYFELCQNVAGHHPGPVTPSSADWAPLMDLVEIKVFWKKHFAYFKNFFVSNVRD